MTTIKDFKEVISSLLEMVGMVGKERLSAGTKHRLTGLAVDIVEVAEALNREVLERVKHEAVLDVDVDVDFVEWSELVLGAELAVRQEADEAVKEQTVLLNDALEALSSGTEGQVSVSQSIKRTITYYVLFRLSNQF